MGKLCERQKLKLINDSFGAENKFEKRKKTPSSLTRGGRKED
jgi:hypothetical protein